MLSYETRWSVKDNLMVLSQKKARLALFNCERTVETTHVTC